METLTHIRKRKKIGYSLELCWSRVVNNFYPFAVADDFAVTTSIIKNGGGPNMAATDARTALSYVRDEHCQTCHLRASNRNFQTIISTSEDPRRMSTFTLRKQSSHSVRIIGECLSNCVGRCCELANKGDRSIVHIVNAFRGSSQLQDRSWKTVGDLYNVCSQLVLVREQVCSRSLQSDMSLWLVWYPLFITNDCRLCGHVGNTGSHCTLSLFQDSDSVGNVDDSTSGGILPIFGSRTIVP